MFSVCVGLPVKIPSDRRPQIILTNNITSGNLQIGNSTDPNYVLAKFEMDPNVLSLPKKPTNWMKYSKCSFTGDRARYVLVHSILGLYSLLYVSDEKIKFPQF